MEIGTLGAGAFAQAFAKRALKAGYKVRLSNSRGPTTAVLLLDEFVNKPSQIKGGIEHSQRGGKVLLTLRHCGYADPGKPRKTIIHCASISLAIKASTIEFKQALGFSLYMAKRF
jgi:predicted dinucleotide-binding enzyme